MINGRDEASDLIVNVEQSTPVAERARMLTGAYVEHRHAVLAVARSLCGDDAASDVAQEVFLRLWHQPDRFDPARGSLRTYLLTITRGVAVDHIRATSARRRREDRVGGFATMHTPDIDDDIVRDETAAEVEAAIESLGPHERHVIVTAFLEEYSYREVARRSGLAEGTVKSRIRRGLLQLRSSLAN